MEPLDAADPTRVGPYTLHGRLGAGGLGAVYLGRSAAGRLVAVRVLRGGLARDEGFRTRFAAEVTAARAVSGRLTAAVVDADPEAETPWMATAFVAGVPLSRAVAEHGPLPESALFAVAAGIAEALQSVHAAGLIHRDLKPGNVLLAADGAHVVDFAIAGALGDAEPGTVLGSPAFLAPEQALGRTVTAAADSFSLGSTLYFAATGRVPFGRGTTGEVLTRVGKSSLVLGFLPQPVAELLGACLARDPNARATASQVLEFVERRGSAPVGWPPAGLTADIEAVGAAVAGLGPEDGDPHATLIAPVVGGAAGSGSVLAQPVGGGSGTMSSGPGQAAGQSAPFTGGPMDPGSGQFAAAAGLAGGPGQAAEPVPASPNPSRRNFLFALTGGAVVVAGGAAAAVSFGGSSGTVPEAARSSPPAGAQPSVPVPSSTAAAPAPSSSVPAAVRKPLPPSGPLPAPGGQAGVLDGPVAQAYWSVRAEGDVCSIVAAGGAVVCLAERGLTAYDLGGNVLWGPLPVAGVRGSGNGAVAQDVAYFVAQGGAPVVGAPLELVAVDVKGGGQKWRTPLPNDEWAQVRVCGVAGGVLLVAANAAGTPVLGALDAATGRPLWDKAGVEYTTVAVPSGGASGPGGGASVLTAGAHDAFSGVIVQFLDAHTGAAAWSQTLQTDVDYSRPSFSKAAFAGVQYVLLGGAMGADGLFAGALTSGQRVWDLPLNVVAEDQGALAHVVRAPDADIVFVTTPHGLYAADAAAGRLLWQTQCPDELATQPVGAAPQSADGNVYVYDHTGTWWAVDAASGRTRWRFAMPASGVDPDPAWVAAPGGVVAGTGGMLTMITAAGV